MILNRLLLRAFVVTAVVVSMPAMGAINRSFVASAGSDANAAANCALAAPCRSFAVALTVTSSGGEILALDSAGYGPLTIDRSVSITGPDGFYAGITVSSGDGVSINTAGIDVTLKGLTINGVGGANGIHMTNGASLRVEKCTVTGFGSSGTAAINISAAAKVLIWDTVVARSNVGIVIDGGAIVDISRVKAVSNTNHGIAMMGASEVTTVAVVSDSIASGNGVWGFVAVGVSANTTGGFPGCGSTCIRKMTVTSSVADHNTLGMGTVSSGTATTMTVANSVISNNSVYGLDQFGGTLKSAQNNVLTDNAIPVGGVLSTGGIIY